MPVEAHALDIDGIDLGDAAPDCGGNVIQGNLIGLQATNRQLQQLTEIHLRLYREEELRREALVKNWPAFSLMLFGFCSNVERAPATKVVHWASEMAAKLAS